MGFNVDEFINKSFRLAMIAFIAILFTTIQIALVDQEVDGFVTPEEVHRRTYARAFAIFVACPILYIFGVVFISLLVFCEPKLQVPEFIPEFIKLWLRDGRVPDPVPEGATVAVSSNGHRPDDFCLTPFRRAVAITGHIGLWLTSIISNVYLCGIPALFLTMAIAVLVFGTAYISVRAASGAASPPHRELSSESGPTEKTV